MQYPVKLHENELTLIEGALLKADDGSACFQVLLHKIQHKRNRLAAMRTRIKENDTTERKPNGGSNFWKRAAADAQADTGIDGQGRVFFRQAVGPKSQDAV